MSMTDVNLEQALDRIQELHRENNELRDYLKDNNEKMKLQYQNLSEWKEKIRVNNGRNKEKYDQTKEVVQTLTRENANLSAEVSAKATELQQLQRSVVEMDSDLRSKQEALTELRKTVEEMRQSPGSQAGAPSSDCLDTVLVNHDSVETAAIMKENVLLKTQISELENKVKQFRENNDSLMLDLDSYKTVKQELQENNAKLERENTELGQRIEGLLNENKGMKSETKMLRNRVEEVVQQMSRVQASAVSSEEDRKTQAAEMAQTELGDLRQRLKQKDEKIAYYKEQQQHHISDLTKQHQQQRQELLQQLDCLQHELQQTKDEQTKALTSDVQSLRSQVLTLISQVTESQNKLEAANDALEKKSGRFQELEHSSAVQHDEFQRQRAQDAGLVETLRLCLKSYEDALNAERKEHQNTKKTSVELRHSFNQLVSDHKNLSEKYDKVRMQEKSGCTETEKQKLLDQIGHLTAQVYAGEEAINYREEKLKEVEEENKKIKEELNNVVPVLMAQAEVWKSDFDAERDSRERLHAESCQLQNELKQLQLRNQQLLDEMEFSKRQFQEMQQRHASQGYQHSLQQHLRVGQQNHGSPYQPPVYPTQSYRSPAMGAGVVYDNRSTNMAMGKPRDHHTRQQDQEVVYNNSILPMDHRRNSAQDVLRCHLCETPVPPMYCDICNLNFCKLCVGEHLSDESTEHKVVPFKKRRSALYCLKHSTKLCYLHCEQCDIPIYVQCVSADEHLGHKQNDILKFLENKNDTLQKDLKELENFIYPKYHESAFNISVQKADLSENTKKLKTALDEQGEILHREIDNVLELKNKIDETEVIYFTVLDKQEDKIKGNISEITQIIADVKKLINSNDVSLVSSYTSSYTKFRRFPPKLKVALPSLSPQKINKQQIYQQFGSLSAEGITPQDYAFKSNSPRTLSSHLDITQEDDMLVDTVIEEDTNREIYEMKMLHTSEAHCQTIEVSMKQKQRIKSAATQSRSWQQRYDTDYYSSRYQQGVGSKIFSNPYSSQPLRRSYPAWTTKPGAVHKNRKPLKKSLGQYNTGSREGVIQCPKCNQTFPDSDTLQVHVLLDCIHQDMT